MESHALVPAFGMTAQGTHLHAPRFPSQRSSYRDSNTPSWPTIILVHGAFVDGSAWQAVHRILRTDGYTVRIAQNPTTSLADDAAAIRRVVELQDGPVILVGHSYGGAVITEAGSHPKVVGLVYIAAFAPDTGESVSWLMNDPTPGTPVPPIIPAQQDGFLLLDRSKFAASFAADVDAETARHMAESQVPWGIGALTGTVTEPAWRRKPSWYLVAADDKMIPARAQWAMAKRAGSRVTETGGSHALYVSKPAVVASTIANAARGAAVAAKCA
jgi:pimeloyl-ACP methyl ester carboxylesterase